MNDIFTRLISVSIKSAYLFSVLLIAGLVGCAKSAPEVSALQEVDNFYKIYLGPQVNSDGPSPFKHSKTLQQAMDGNRQICQEYATSVCGWDGEGDPYLLAIMEVGDDVTYETANIKIAELSPNMIQVTLNPRPIYHPDDVSVITYKMIREEGVWVADDIFYGEDLMSVREYIKEENAGYLANPDQDSIADKKRSGAQ